MKMTMMLSLYFCALQHPIALMIIMICITLTSSLMIITIQKSSWLTLMLILVVLGGTLVLFIYIASLASNESLKMKKAYLLIPIFFWIWWPILQPLNFSEMNMYPLYMASSGLNSLAAIFYLLTTLLVVMETITCYKAPLQAKM